MTARYTMSAKEFGDALVLHAQEEYGSIYFPFFLRMSSYTPPRSLVIEHAGEDKLPLRSTRTHPRSYTVSEIVEKTYSMTKDELYTALVRWVCFYRLYIPYNGSQILSVTPALPNTISFALAYRPMLPSDILDPHVYGGLK